MVGARPTVVDLCCGCGGFSLGFIQGGYDVICGVDNDPQPLTTYFHNLAAPDARWIGEMPKTRFKRKFWDNGEPPLRNDNTSWKRTVKVVICKDISELFGWDILEVLEVDHVDAVIGSPPCGSFSPLGKRKVGDPRDSLLFEFGRIIKELQPEAWAMENVPGLISKKLPSGSKLLDIFVRFMEMD